MDLGRNSIHGFHGTAAAGFDLFHTFSSFSTVVLHFLRILLQLFGTGTDVVDRRTNFVHAVTDVLHIFRHFFCCSGQLIHGLTDLLRLFHGSIASLCHLPYTVQKFSGYLLHTADDLRQIPLHLRGIQ